jgi:hypothetical protein
MLYTYIPIDCYFYFIFILFFCQLLKLGLTCTNSAKHDPFFIAKHTAAEIDENFFTLQIPLKRRDRDSNFITLQIPLKRRDMV